jgi:KaiC/GvpD/RAD55 family RecA-like ATPase
MKYVRLCKGVSDKGTLVSKEQVMDLVDDTHDWYVSTFSYTEEHKKKFEESGSIRGIEDVSTDYLYWDFDDKVDPQKAMDDAKTLVSRLSKNMSGEPEIYMSGGKGFHVIVKVDHDLTPEQTGLTCIKLAEGLKTLDLSVYNASRILRVPGTKHQKTGLYKFPLTSKELLSWDFNKVKSKAVSLDNTHEYSWGKYNIAKDEIVSPTPKQNKTTIKDVDLTQKPSHWKPYKWAIAQGHFDSGERHQALMVLAATCRGLGYDKDTTYYICKSALKKQAARTGQDEFPKEELYQNIIEQSIFSDNWEGGQYSPKNNPWLAKYCERMGIKVEENDDEKECVEVLDMEKQFTGYAQNFEQNIVKTGIAGIDKNVLFLASTHNGVLGAPGGGKTAFSLEYLRNTSKAGINSVFLSLDMGLPMIYSKLVQKATGMSFKEVMEVYRSNPKKAAELTEMIKADYSNVSFNFKSGLTVADIRTIIKNEQERTGKPIKLLVTDYLECLAGPYSDATANTGFICQQLKDLANEMNVCSILLLQTQKHSTGEISDPLLSMRQIKGSSVIEQSCSTVLTLWREGYNPKTVEDDKYISFATVKNRFGSLWTDDFGWNGVKGDISELTEEQHGELAAFKERKRLAKIAAEKEKSGDWE